MAVHESVLLEESLFWLKLKAGDCVIDMTAGYGGHSGVLLEHIGDKGKLISIDRDPQAIKALQQRFNKNHLGESQRSRL